MALFSHETRSRFPGFEGYFDRVEKFYEWNCSELPSSLRYPDPPPDRGLGVIGTDYIYRLLSRSRDLVHGVAVACNAQNMLAGVMAARGHYETTGAVALFLRKLKLHYSGEMTDQEIDEVVKRFFLGSRELPSQQDHSEIEVPEPLKVGRMIEAADKESRALGSQDGLFIKHYAVLSEYCHPNFAGVNVGTNLQEGWGPRFSQVPQLAHDDLGLLLTHFIQSPTLFEIFFTAVRQLLKRHESVPVIYRYM